MTAQDGGRCILDVSAWLWRNSWHLTRSDWEPLMKRCVVHHQLATPLNLTKLFYRLFYSRRLETSSWDPGLFRKQFHWGNKSSSESFTNRSDLFLKPLGPPHAHGWRLDPVETKTRLTDFVENWSEFRNESKVMLRNHYKQNIQGHAASDISLENVLAPCNKPR